MSHTSVRLADGNETSDATGITILHDVESGLHLARTRFENFDEDEIKWQVQVIRENTRALSRSAGKTVENFTMGPAPCSDVALAPMHAIFIREADKMAEEIANRAVRRGPGAAWIGLDWLGDAEVFQLVCLGPDLYNGTSGIGVFLAAHAAVTGRPTSAELARASVSYLRKNLKSRDAARIARSMGVGGATGLGSIVYALTLMASYLRDDSLLADAHVAAELFTEDLIAADKQLDIIGGSAGAILCLLRLHRDGRSDAVLTLRGQVWRTPHGSKSTWADRSTQLGGTRFGSASTERHVTRRSWLCVRAGVVVGSVGP